jgi:hypothetical protein
MTSAERFTDEDLAHLRQLRFGTAPEPVRPEDYVQMVETESPSLFPDGVPDIERPPAIA